VKKFLPLFICLIIFLFLTGPVEAKDYVWTKVRVDLNLERDGGLWVEETRSLKFWGNFHYAFIDIKKNEISGVSDVSVWEEGMNYKMDQSGLPGTFQVIDSENLVSIYWYYDYADTERTFHVKYQLLKAAELGTISFYSDFDQLYFKAIGADHEKPMQFAEVYIHIPGGTQKEDLHLWGYGPPPGTGTATILDAQTAYLAVGPLDAGAGIECRLLFPTGIISLPENAPRLREEILPKVQAEQAQVERRERLIRILKDAEYVLAIALAVLTPLYMLFLWWRKGKEYRVSYASAMISGPPSALPAAGVDVLFKQKTTPSGLVATVFDLAHRGAISVKEEEKDYLLIYQKDPEEMKPFEEALLNALFSGKKEQGKAVYLSSLKTNLSKRMASLEKKVWKAVEPLKLFEGNPQKIRDKYAAAGVLMVITGILLVGFQVAIILGISLIWSSLFVLGFGSIMPRRSVTGMREILAWKAFLRYMEELMRRPVLANASNIFSEYLPYSIVLGIQKNWVKSFSGRSNFSPPEWWVSAGFSTGFTVVAASSFASAFNQAFSDFYARVSSSFASASSSGGSGGGFSGGGGGGGGGGGSGAG